MKGQVWGEFLILVLAVVLGALISINIMLDTLEGGGALIKATPVLIREEVALEQESMKIYEVERFYYDRGLVLRGPNELIDRLRARGINVRAG